MRGSARLEHRGVRWESRENDQWNRVARSYPIFAESCMPWIGLARAWTTRPVPLRGHSSKNIEGELHQSKKIIRKFWLRGWRKSPWGEIKTVEPVPLAQRSRMGWSTFQNHRQLLLFQVPFARIFYILFNCFKIATIYGVPGDLCVLCLLIPSNISKGGNNHWPYLAGKNKKTKNMHFHYFHVK